MGYNGRILFFDLSKGSTEVQDLNRDYAKDFLGGTALAARYIYGLADPDIDPLSPENPLVFMAGPLTGTGAPNTSRHAVCAYSPLTGIWGEGTSGGRFGMELKRAGWDGIIVTGKSEDMVYLSIADAQVEIVEAEDLQGKGTYETQEAIKQNTEEGVSVSCIGRAGENLVNYACIINDDARAVGRCGLGAVMGSKNLKAIAVSGSSLPKPVEKGKFRKIMKEAADEVEGGLKLLFATDFAKKTSQRFFPLISGIPGGLLKYVSRGIMDSFNARAMENFGTAAWVGIGEAFGDVPVKYFTEAEFEKASDIDGVTMQQEILTDNYNCPGCPIGCGRKIKLAEGEYKLDHDDGPEYETIASMGPMLMIGDLEPICYLNELCNKYGIDTISAGVSISFAFYLFDEGIIDEKEVGTPLEWGDPDAAAGLIEVLVKKEGFGKILAQGVKKMGEEYGVEELSAHVKGLEIPMHDPRAFHSMAVTYATSPRGACHNRGDTFRVHTGVSEKEIDVEPIDRFKKKGSGKLAAKWQDYREVYNSAPICEFVNPKAQLILDLLKYSTGVEYSLEDLMKMGERSVNLKRILNLRRGITAEDDKLPEIIMRPLGGGTKGKVPDLDYMLDEYYDFRGWDKETGKPKKEKLEELELDSMIEDIWD